jgi:hypothetical protein
MHAGSPDSIRLTAARRECVQVLKKADAKVQLKAVDVIRNMAAAGADTKLVRAVVDDLVAMVQVRVPDICLGVCEPVFSTCIACCLSCEIRRMDACACRGTQTLPLALCCGHPNHTEHI